MRVVCARVLSTWLAVVEVIVASVTVACVEAASTPVPLLPHGPPLLALKPGIGGACSTLILCGEVQIEVQVGLQPCSLLSQVLGL